MESNENGLVLELEVPDYTLRENTVDGKTYHTLQVPGAGQTVDPNQPQLPMVGALIGVPPQAEVTLELIADDAFPLSLPQALAPAPQPLPLDKDLQPGETGYLSAAEKPLQPPAGALGAYHPAAAAQIVEEAWIRDQRVVRLALYPFQVEQGTGRLVWHQKLRVAVRFQNPAGQAASAAASTDLDPFDPLLNANLLNYETARGWKGRPPADDAAEASALSPAAADPRYRIAVRQDGLYRLTYSALQQAGLDVADLDPTRLALTNQGEDVALWVANLDGNPNRFSSNEYLLFYGQKFSGERMAQRYADENAHWMTFNRQMPDGSTVGWKPEMNATMFEKYTDENVYWLAVGTQPGPRMAETSGAPGAASQAASYRATAREEQSKVWKTTLFAGEDTWFWEEIVTTSSATRVFTTNLDGVAAPAGDVLLSGELVAANYNLAASPDHQVDFYLNDGPPSAPHLTVTWEGKSRYRFSGALPADKLKNGVNELWVVVHKTAALASERLYFDWFEIEYDRTFTAAQNRLAFGTSQAGTWKYNLTGFTAGGIEILDVTQPMAPKRITQAAVVSGGVNFQANHAAGAQFFAAVPVDVPAADISAYTPPDFSAAADYLIITHRDFLPAAQRLADYRAGQGLAARVIDVADLYNQFNDGIYHPLAIKSFLKWAFANWSSPPSYVVLVGDGHWNLKGYPAYDSPPVFMPPHLVWGDPWQGEVDSASLLANVVGSDPMPDVYISRIPVNSAAELDRVIDKTLAYEATNIYAAGADPWFLRVLSVADNTPDPAGDFLAFSEAIINSYLNGGYIPDRLYLNDFIDDPKDPNDTDLCGPRSGGRICPEATRALTETLSINGALLVNYIGHASLNFWSHEQLFINQDIASLNNTGRLPVVLSMTCLDGYWLHPSQGSGDKTGPGLVEELLRAEGKGIVAGFSPTGLGVSTGHDALERGFYEAVMHQGVYRLGPAAQAAKLKLYASGGYYDLLHTFTIFGDPALHLISPHRMEFDPGPTEDAGGPGYKVEYSVQITNTGLLEQSFDLFVDEGDWDVEYESVVGPLAPGAGVRVPLTVAIPDTAQEGAQDSFDLRVASQHDITQTDAATFTTTAQDYGVAFIPAVVDRSAQPGTTLTVEVQVQNKGVFPDSYTLAQESGSWLASPAFPQDVGPLNPNESVTLNLVIQVPESADRNTTDIIQLRAVSQAEPSKQAEAKLTTRVQGYSLFLPEIKR